MSDPPGAPMAVDAVVPAHNEESTVKAVVETLVCSALFGRVFVVDDGSSDGTAAAAFSAGAEVVSLAQNQGKMHAMMVGVAHSQAPALAFFDADLENLSLDHVRALVGGFRSGAYAQVCGTYDQGIMNRSKIATGQRIVLREILEGIPCSCGGYSAETAINYFADKTGGITTSIELTGLRQRHKIDKFGVVSGLARNAEMVAGMAAAHVALAKSHGTTCDLVESVGAGDIVSVVSGAVGGAVAGVPGAIVGGLAGRLVGAAMETPGPACTWNERISADLVVDMGADPGVRVADVVSPPAACSVSGMSDPDDTNSASNQSPTPTSCPAPTPCDNGSPFQTLLNIATVAGCALHGVRRNNGSWGWGLAWGLFALTVPVIPPVLAIVQEVASPTPTAGPA